MNTTPEAAGHIVTLLRQQLAGEPLPSFHTPEADQFSQALQTLANRAAAADLATIGGATLQLLIERWQAAALAERAALQARLSAIRPGGAEG